MGWGRRCKELQKPLRGKSLAKGRSQCDPMVPGGGRAVTVHPKNERGKTHPTQREESREVERTDQGFHLAASGTRLAEG